MPAPGCSSGQASESASPLARAASVDTSADWDDVGAAVAAALSESELVEVRADRSDPARLVDTLRTSRDEPAVLTVERLDEPDSSGPVRLRVTCSIGRFGDPEREREFIALIVDRLERLRGVEVAPIE